MREPRGLERVTRHPFFVGVALLGAAHALLAPRLVGAVAMGSLALLAGVGAWFQDRKLLALRGERYARLPGGDLGDSRSPRSWPDASGWSGASSPTARCCSGSRSPGRCARSTRTSSTTAART